MWPSPCGNPAGNMCKAISPSGNPALYVYAALHVYRNVYTAISHSENPAKHLDMAISPNGNPALNVKPCYYDRICVDRGVDRGACRYLRPNPNTHSVGMPGPA